MFFVFFFFNDTATTEIYTLSLHDALPIWCLLAVLVCLIANCSSASLAPARTGRAAERSEEHTSELQSPCNLVCRLLLEKKKKKLKNKNIHTSRKSASESDVVSLSHSMRTL